MSIDEVTLREIKLKYRLILGGDYEQLKVKGFVPRPGVKPIKLALPFKWRYPDRNVEFTLHSWRFLNPFFSKFLLSSDASYLIEAIEYVKDWQSYKKSEDKKSQFLWYDMAVGLRSIILGFFLELYKKNILPLDDDSLLLLSDLAAEHIDNLSCEKNITAGNHALYQVMGLRILSLSIGRDKEFFSYCSSILENLISLSFDKYSVNTENSPFYHGYNVELLSRMRCGVFPGLDEKINNIIREGSAITGWLTGIDGDYYSVGDSEGEGKPIKSAGPFDPVESRVKHVHKDLSPSGYIAVRTHPRIDVLDSFSLLFHATNSSYVHAHADHLSFIVFLRGQELITDPGKYTYEYGAWRDYFVSDKAHNVIGLSDRVFLPKDIPLGAASIDPIELGESFYRLSGSVKKSEDFSFSRSLLYKPECGLLLHDTVHNQTSSNSEVRFHFGKDVQAVFEDGIISLKKNESLLAILKPQNNFSSISIRSGEEAGFGWASKSYNDKFEIDVLVIEYDASVSEVITEIIFKM
ncbi:heparinase II/III domain-containing protein [Alcaligenes sp. GCM10023179]|uniref:heparinase II/III domain-containing protein n=1 Tax=Alcaligenes sp. GCM10023179 TaxID=3252633 RepID=UPI003614E89A